MSFWKWNQRVRRINAEALALFLACRDPRTPWHAKAFALLVVAYAFSPIDLIPDFIPGAGYLDDLVLVPLGIMIARRLIPTTVLVESRRRADAVVVRARPLRRTIVVVVVIIWLVLTGLGIWLLVRAIRGDN